MVQPNELVVREVRTGTKKTSTLDYCFMKGEVLERVQGVVVNEYADGPLIGQHLPRSLDRPVDGGLGLRLLSVPLHQCASPPTPDSSSSPTMRTETPRGPPESRNSRNTSITS